MYSTDTVNQKVNELSSDFYYDVLDGLTQSPKRLSSKYFYDAKGDALFQAIMNAPEYYLTRCEMEIFIRQSAKMVDSLKPGKSDFELIELGPGNCAKSIHLLLALQDAEVLFHYIPIDISSNVISTLDDLLPAKLPHLQFEGRIGDYFDQLALLETDPVKRRVVMCLGGNIGNMTMEESSRFCQNLRGYLNPGDQCIIGFDLIKHPNIIRQAYDDKNGLTRAFNLNLLHRINKELKADFQLDQFEHYCSYDPVDGAAKSYLVSLKEAVIHLSGAEISLDKDECIWTEISQKYSRKQIHQMAVSNGFVPAAEFLDSKSWFMDAIWTAV